MASRGKANKRAGRFVLSIGLGRTANSVMFGCGLKVGLGIDDGIMVHYGSELYAGRKSVF